MHVIALLFFLCCNTKTENRAKCTKYETFTKIVSDYDQEIPQSQTADSLMAPRGRAT